MMRRERRGVFGRITPALVVVVAALSVEGCAMSEERGWQPPRWSDAQGVPIQLAEYDGAESAPAAVFGEGTATEGLEFFEGRIRNDAAKLQLRYVEIPGSNPFNEQVNVLLRAAIDGTGADFSPQVYGQDAELSERGCVAGSLEWPAEQVLSDPETGPNGGTGTALTCDVVSAFGDFVGVGFRTVTSGDAGVSDMRTVLYADVASEESAAPGGLWVEGAAEALWISTVDQLRRQTGSLSAAEIAAPGDSQLALATAALGSANFDSEGGVTFTMPAGVTAPELEDFGIEQTTEPLNIELDAATLEEFGSEQLAVMQEQQDEPFVGMPAWTAAQDVDCSIVACIALTYDDGPGPYTGKLLDTLYEHRSAATFYMLGDLVAGDPDTVRRMADEGHEVGSHTMSHLELTLIPLDQATAQVVDAKDLIEETAGVSAPTFRPPYGSVNDAIIKAVDMPAILWTIDTNDWRKPGLDALISSVVPPAQPDDIVLWHDIHPDSVDVADTVIRGLKNRGFTLVTVTQLFGGDVPVEKIGGW